MARAKSIDGEVVDTDFATVFPVEGTYLNDVPHVPTITDDATAARLVRTGAFRYEAPEATEGEQAPEILVSELPESALAVLDTYDPPDAPTSTEPDGPPEGGPPDSTTEEV